MLRLDLTEPGEPASSEPLVLAARALLAWARTREAGWDETDATAEGIGLPAARDPSLASSAGAGLRAAGDSAAPLLTVPEPPSPIAQLSEPTPDSASEPLPPPIIAYRPKPSPFAARVLIRAAAPSIGRWAVRAAIVGLLVAGGIKGREYLQRQAAIPKTGVVVLESLPAGSEVVVDGRTLGTTPVTTTLPAGTYTVVFRLRNAARSVQVTVPVGGRVSEIFDWTRKPTGVLEVTSTPPGARVLIDGQPRGVAPISVADLAVGPHVVVLESSEGTIRRSVTITEGAATRLAETIVAGWLRVFSPFEVTIVEGDRALKLDESGQVLLPAGTHALRFENREFGYEEVRRVEVGPGQQTTLSLVPPRSKLTVNASVPSEVWIDGAHVGQTPLVDQPIELGTRDVVVKSASGDERRLTLTVTAKPATVSVDFAKPPSFTPPTPDR